MSSYTKKSQVLSPSVGSLVLSTVGVLVAIVITVLPRLGGDVLLRLLLGTDPTADIVAGSTDDYSVVFQEVLSSDLLGRVVVFGIWMFIGLCVFILISTVSKIFTTIEEETEELTYVHQKKKKLLKDDLTTVAFKVFVAALWAGFAVLSLRFVVGYFALTGYLVWVAGSTSDWLHFLVASLSLLIIIHIHVVFARLLVGKTRLWESQE